MFLKAVQKTAARLGQVGGQEPLPVKHLPPGAMAWLTIDCNDRDEARLVFRSPAEAIHLCSDLAFCK